MKKLFTKLLVLILILFVGVSNINGQLVSLVNSNFSDWSTAPANGGSGNGTTVFTIPGASVIFKGAAYNSTSLPGSGTSVSYPNFFRFGSNMDPQFPQTVLPFTMNNQYVKITPTLPFINGGKITVTISNNNAAGTDFQVGDLESGVLLGGTNTVKNTFEDVVIYLPSDYNGVKSIIIGKKATTIFLHAIKIETNQANPSIAGFAVAGIEATIDQSAKTITAELPYGTNLSSLEPAVTIGGTATSYSPTGAKDFSAGAVTYSAIGSTTVDYAVTLTASAVANTDATLSDLKIDGATVTAFDPATLTYEVALPYAYEGLPVVNSTVNAVTSNQSFSQVSTIPGAATITVTAQNNSSKIYTVNFTRTPASSACDITSFSINNRIGVITGTDILVQMHLTNVVTSLTPIVTVSTFANLSPSSAQNFSSPVEYIVTAQDGTQKKYMVTVELIDMQYSGSYPYTTNFPTGFSIPVWMSSPTNGISISDPYTGSDKALWYDNEAETTAASASVMRLNSSTSIEFLVSKCQSVTAKLSGTGSRVYNLYINNVLVATSGSIASNTEVVLTNTPNLNEPTVIRVENPSTSGGITLGYLEITASVGTDVETTKSSEIIFDGKTIRNVNNEMLKLYDATGRMIFSSTEDISMANRPTGIYVIKSLKNAMKIANVR